ncbi:DsrE family protein [Alienimonas californiensis]|uniref:DsrE/DsrF-like family protein n=1 Tax=Alienimonas californiensis TaxID=2527989 RepID=A0A517PBB2_9PLAN|nr:DsrE family protein [Alienimonas californiensis]QDT16667.1 DsrE/DsrF-like family protein [Alienimonas californiensis]
MKTLMTLGLPTLVAAALVADPTGTPEFEYPLIKGHGGIVVLPEAAQQPKKSSKVVLDITSDEKSGGVIKGFDRAALILNQYTQAGAGTDDGLKMALILHGPATQAALRDDAYVKRSKPYAQAQGPSSNPNLDVIQKLRKEGVEIYVCGQALAHHGFATDEVAPEVTVAVSAATVNINLQMDGYAYLPFMD